MSYRYYRIFYSCCSIGYIYFSFYSWVYFYNNYIYIRIFFGRIFYSYIFRNRIFGYIFVIL